MKKITIEINTTNAAFEEGYKNIEVARILKEFANGLEEYSYAPTILKDINGNTVGRVEIL